MKAGWGSGKTTAGIAKIELLANAYADNLLLICRENFANLSKSTMRDYELYTGRHVKVGAKECVYPNGSRVLFSHADDIQGMVQNINLGGFYIEQGEEFDTSDVFVMLGRGRMRRKLELDEHFFDQIDKAIAQGGISGQAKAFYDYIRTHSGENALNQGIVIANANGRNWIWHNWKRDAARIAGGEHWGRWENPQKPDFVMWEADSFANEHNLKPDFVKSLRDMQYGTETEKRKYRMYVLNLDDEVDLEGAYYAQLMAEARREGRIGKCPPDRSLATHTMWDLGIGDTTAIWFIQKAGREVRHVHCYENDGESIQHYVRYLESVKKRLNLHYGQHFWPHDGKKRDLSTGKELHATAEEMGLKVTFIDKEKRVEDGIERVRKMIPDCVWDETECRKGIEALEHYQRRKNQHMSTEEKAVFQDAPLHDWASNLADGERYVSAAIRKLGGAMSVDRVRELARMYT